jgi:hypothetical protein
MATRNELANSCAGLVSSGLGPVAACGSPVTLRLCRSWWASPWPVSRLTCSGQQTDSSSTLAQLISTGGMTRTSDYTEEKSEGIQNAQSSTSRRHTSELPIATAECTQTFIKQQLTNTMLTLFHLYKNEKRTLLLLI